LSDKCINHPEKNAFTKCDSCGRSYCEECLQKSGDKYYCYHHGCQLVLKIENQKKSQSVEFVNPTELKKASILLRIINFIIDVVIFRAVMTLTLDQLFSKQFINQENFTMTDIIIFFSQIILLILYFFIFESLFQKTPAKFITRTKVVDLKGDKPKMRTFLLRSILRFLPFEIFSVSFNDKTWWHDRLSKTIVVQEKSFVVDYEENDLDD
jgi:uncharacterized RDD family membrane protein YckC